MKDVDEDNQFTIKMDADWFTPSDILTNNVTIISEPRPYIYSWWRRLIYKITFGYIGKCWISGYEYECKWTTDIVGNTDINSV